ncbi:MAG: LamG-like jellyroll fold domain-containing protein [Bacteroidales bacterium]
MKVKNLKFLFFLLVQFIVVDSCGYKRDSTPHTKGITELSDTFNIIYYQDFSKSEPGIYTKSEIIAENNAEAYINGAGEHGIDDYNLSIVSVKGDKALKGTQDKGEYGLTGAVNDNDNGGGFRYQTMLPQGHLEMYLSYNIMFRPGMDFVLHGKLPALSGGKWNNYDGESLTGFTALPAFSGDKNGDVEGGIYWYSRWATDQTSGGNGHWKNPDGTPFHFDVSDSTWYNITIRVSLNTMGQANGFMEGYVNGKLASQWTNLELRSVESFIDIINVYWFYGGADAQFATNFDEWVLVDDICAFTYASSMNVPRGQTPSTPGRILDLPFLKTYANSETEIDQEPPSVPVGLEVLGKDQNSISIGWTASSDNVGVEGYGVFLNDSYFESTSDTKFTLGNLIAGTSYKITVYAFDKAENKSAHTQAVNTSTENENPAPPNEDMVPPSKPMGLKAELATENTIELSWSSSSDNVAVTGYHIYVNGLKKGPASSNTFTLTGLIPGFEYHITVTAFDAEDNESLKSNDIVAYTKNSIATATPALPSVKILDVVESTNPSAISVLNSFGFVEIEDYGIVYSEDRNLIENCIPIYADQNNSTTLNKYRIQNNLQALYNFSDESDNRISDVSGVEQSVDLIINQPLNTKRLPGQGLDVVRSAIISSETNAEKLVNTLIESSGITLEAWIKPDMVNQSGPATVLAMHSADNKFAFSVEQNGNEDFLNYTVRIKTSDTVNNGIHEIRTASNFSKELPHHIVYTCEYGKEEVIYVDGKKIQSGVRIGNLSPENSDYQLTLANDLLGSSSWNGTYYLIAIYDKPLTEGEVSNNHRAGFGQIEYETDLSFLKTNTQYYIAPFVRTDQGVFFGEEKGFMVRNLLDFAESDEMNMEVVPNPTNGQFLLSFEDKANIETKAMLRIVDVSGRVLFSEMVNIMENLNSFQREYDLSSTLKSGIYTVMLILGNKSIAKRLVLY